MFHLRSGNDVWFDSQFCLPLFTIHIYILSDGRAFNHTQVTVHQNGKVDRRDEWGMEVDLRSREKEKRTLHWFVNGEQQKGFIKGVPERVEFGV